jgi:hypothetical protein
VEALPLDSNNRYGNVTNYTIIDPAPGELAGYPSIPGPLLRAYSYTWDAGSGAPIHSSDLLTLVCPLDIQLLDAVPRCAPPPRRRPACAPPSRPRACLTTLPLSTCAPTPPPLDLPWIPSSALP